MSSLPILFLTVITRLHQALRNHAYDEMSHIAGSWFVTKRPVRNNPKPAKTISINFAQPREQRLIRANRRIGSLPY